MAFIYLSRKLTMGLSLVATLALGVHANDKNMDISYSTKAAKIKQMHLLTISKMPTLVKHIYIHLTH